RPAREQRLGPDRGPVDHDARDHVRGDRDHPRLHRQESGLITKTEELPVLGFMLGDYTGIGPEQCARVLADGRLRDAARLLVVGDSRVLAQGSRDAGVEVLWTAYNVPEDVDLSRDDVPMIFLGNLDPGQGFARGVMSPTSGRIAGETLAHMIELALAGRIDGIT